MTMEAKPSEQRLNLAVIVEIARTVVRTEAIAQAICAHALAGLGLASASISLVSGDADEPRLDSVAAVGQLSSFVREMSTPLEALGDAGKAALGGDAVFIGNPHGVKEDAEQTTGIGRWRDGLGVHAYAVLGLTVIEGTIGVVTLEWPEPQPFDESDRQSLTLFADVVAVVLQSALLRNGDAPAALHTESARGHVDLATYIADSDGTIVSAPDPETAIPSATQRIWTAVSSPEFAESPVPFAEIMGGPDGTVTLAVGTVSAGPLGGAVEAAAAAREVVRAAAARGSSPSEILALVGGAMRSRPGAAWASAAIASIRSNTGVAEITQAGSVCALLHRREGRSEFATPEVPPVGAGRADVASAMHVVLPGDRIALISGRVAAFADSERLEQAGEALGGTQEIEGAEVARMLHALASADGSAASVAVVEMVAAPPAVADGSSA